MARIAGRAPSAATVPCLLKHNALLHIGKSASSLLESYIIRGLGSHRQTHQSWGSRFVLGSGGADSGVTVAGVKQVESNGAVASPPASAQACNEEGEQLVLSVYLPHGGYALQKMQA